MTFFREKNCHPGFKVDVTVTIFRKKKKKKKKKKLQKTKKQCLHINVGMVISRANSTFEVKVMWPFLEKKNKKTTKNKNTLSSP